MITKCLLCFILGIIALTGCSYIPTTKVPSTKAKEYFPVLENTRYRYEGTGNEFATYFVWIDYTKSNHMQRTIDNGGAAIAEVIRLEEDKVSRIYVSQPLVARENFIDQRDEINNQEILLMDPIKKGTSWLLADGGTRTITNTKLSLTTDLDTYEVIEVTTESNGAVVKQYYAKDVGLVQTIYVQTSGNISSTLSSIDRNTTFQQPVMFFFPDIEDGHLVAISRDIHFRTNDPTFPALEEGYRLIIQESIVSVLSINTHIEDVYRDFDNRIRVDISEEYYTELSVGAHYETMIVQAFVNTIGQYYQVDEVILTVGGEPYQSGHLEMQLGEAFRVDLTDVRYLDSLSV